MSDSLCGDLVIDVIVSPWDLWAFTADLGKITNMTTPVVSAIGVIRDPSIQSTQLSGDVETRSAYYQMNFSEPLDIVRSSVRVCFSISNARV